MRSRPASRDSRSSSPFHREVWMPHQAVATLPMPSSSTARISMPVRPDRRGYGGGAGADELTGRRPARQRRRRSSGVESASARAASSIGRVGGAGGRGDRRRTAVSPTTMPAVPALQRLTTELDLAVAQHRIGEARPELRRRGDLVLDAQFAHLRVGHLELELGLGAHRVGDDVVDGAEVDRAQVEHRPRRTRPAGTSRRCGP